MLCQAMLLSEPCYHVFSSHVLTLFSTKEAYPAKPVHKFILTLSPSGTSSSFGGAWGGHYFILLNI